MSRFIGEFEHVVLLALARCGGEAYGASVFEEIVETARRNPSIPSVYVTLGRLAEKGYVEARLSEGLTARGGKGRKLFSLTAEGMEALAGTKRMFERLWRGVELGST